MLLIGPGLIPQKGGEASDLSNAKRGAATRDVARSRLPKTMAGPPS